MNNWIDALERLQKLRESGALTNEEYEAEKRRIMSEGGGASATDDIPQNRTEQPIRVKPKYLEHETSEGANRFEKAPKVGSKLMPIMAITALCVLAALVGAFFLLKPTMKAGDGAVKGKHKENTVTESNAQADIQVVKGECKSQSHIAEGNIGEDLTKRESRFYCDSAIISFFDSQKEHIMVQFAESKSHNNNQLGFSGLMEADGQIMDVNTVYLGERKVRVSEGNCKFFFENKELNGISCGAPVDEEGRRTVPVIAFTASPGQ